MTGQSAPPWAVRLRAEREARGWRKWEMARRLCAAVGIERPDQTQIRNLARQITRHEAGNVCPTEWAPAYATAFDATEEDLFGTPQPSHHAVSEPVGTVEKPDILDDWDDMERRRLLLAALGLSAGAFGTSSEPLRQLLDLVLSSELRSFDEWELACADHLYALRKRPPAEVRDGLSVDLLAIHRQLKTANAGDSRELQRFLAAMSMIQANALTRLGDHGAAVHWWRTGRAAADRSGDLDLRLMIRAEEAGVGLYGQRDPVTVLRLLDDAEGIAGDSSSPWRADFANTRAKALTTLGRKDEAKPELNIWVSQASTGPPSSIIPGHWTGSQVHFTESWVYAATGDEAKADEARDRVLALTADYQYDANVRLHEALCVVVKGGTDRGAHMAAAILDALPLAHRSQMITEMGKHVLRLVPVDQRQRPAVCEYREVLARTAPKPALTSVT